MFRQFNTISDGILKLNRQPIQPTNVFYAYPFLVQKMSLGIDCFCEEICEDFHLSFSTIPVLGREGIEREHLDAQLTAGADYVAHRLAPELVARGLGQLALDGPTPIPIHDDGDVGREIARLLQGLLNVGIFFGIQ